MSVAACLASFNTFSPAQHWFALVCIGGIVCTGLHWFDWFAWTCIDVRWFAWVSIAYINIYIYGRWNLVLTFTDAKLFLPQNSSAELPRNFRSSSALQENRQFTKIHGFMNNSWIHIHQNAYSCSWTIHEWLVSRTSWEVTFMRESPVPSPPKQNVPQVWKSCLCRE